MITTPRIDLLLPPEGTGKTVQIKIQAPTQVQRLLLGIPIRQAFKNLGLLYSLCKCAHAVAYTSAVECADGIPTSPETMLARERLVQLEALQELTWKLMFDLPQLIGLKPQLEWIQYVKQKVRQPTEAMWNTAFGKGSAAGCFDWPDNSLKELANFVLQDGFLSEMSERLKRFDWLIEARGKPQSVLLPLWNQLKNHFLSLLRDDHSSPIGHIWSEPTRHGPACSVSEVYCARGVLSYALCLDEQRRTLTTLNIMPPTLQRFMHGKAIQACLAAIPHGNDHFRLQQAKVYVSLLNPCYACHVELEQSDTVLAGGHRHA